MASCQLHPGESPCLIGGEAIALRENLKYEDLSSNFSEIRVLTLNKSSDYDSPIECYLQHANISDLPKYTALSYVWGDATITEEIFVNRCSFSATTNLVSALRHIRKLDGKITLWVDAICIDQRNVVERGRQVQFMQSIYSKAAKVIAWLGPDYDGGAAALKMLGRISDAFKLHPKGFDWLKSIPELYKGGEDENHVPRTPWTWIDALLVRPYWSRIWILQEAVLARDLWFMCGTERLKFNKHRNLIKVATKLPTLLHADNNFEELQRTVGGTAVNVDWKNLKRIAAFRYSRGQNSPNLDGDLTLLAATCDLQATDPRDKIYGLLGLTNSSILPDYDKPASEVFTEVAKLLISEGCMEVLAYTTLHLQSLKVLDLPSWVPDWYLMSTGACTWLITGYDEYNACGGLEPSEPPQLQHKILHCSGILYDRINGMEAVGGEFFRDYEFLVKIGTLMNESYENVRGLTKLQALILIFHRGRGPDYTRLEVNSESWPQATATFVHLLSDLCDTVKPQSTAQKKREMLNDSLRLRGMSIHNMCFRGSDQTATAILEQVGHFHFRAHAPVLIERLANQQMFYTQKGYVGLGVPGIAEGDIVAIIQGCKVPLILRERGPHFIIVGPCYIPGIMDGEAVAEMKSDIVDLDIR